MLPTLAFRASTSVVLHFFIRAIGIESVTSEFGEFGLEQIGKEFASSADESEK